MSTRESQSEEKLAEWGVEGLGPKSHVLIGGLGLGFTLRRALKLLPKDGKITLSELSPEVIAWKARAITCGASLAKSPPPS